MTDVSTSGRLDRSSRPLSLSGRMVMLAATATALVAVWLVLVILTVLPARGPTSVPFWTVVEVGLLGYVGLTVVYLRTGGRSARTRLVAGLASVAAIAIGGLWAVTALARTSGFEGYLVLMGAMLAVHGVVVLIDVASRRHT